MPALTFLHPIALAGLGAAALPFLIHLLNRKKLARIPFSDLTFLKALQKERMRRVRLRQILALILRTLAVFFVMLALARPALKGALSEVVGAHANTAMAVLVDVSYSMGFRTDQGKVLDRAKERTQQIAGLISEGDEVFLIPFARFPQLPDAPIKDGTLYQEAVGELSGSWENTDVRTAVEAGLDLLSRSEKIHKELFLVTDGAAHGWGEFRRARAEKRSEGDEAKENTERERVPCFLVSLGDWPRDNIGVEAMELPEQLFGAGRPMSLGWRVRNYGDRDLKDGTALLYAGGRRVHQELFDVASGGAAALSAQVSPEKEGPFSGYVAVEEDRLPADDRRYFSVRVPGALRALIVKHRDEDVFFLRRALNPFEKESEKKAEPQNRKEPPARFRGEGIGMTITEKRAERFASEDLKGQDLVILVNVPRLSTAMVRALGEYAARGKGVWIVLGGDVDARFYNRTLLPELIPLTLRSPVGNVGDPSAVRSFGEMDFEHPVLKDLVEKDRMTPPRFYVTYNVDARPEVRPVVRYRDGGIALAEAPKGRGKVMLLTTGGTLEWGDFPRKGLFVPLVQRVARYLGTGLDRDRHLVGDDVVLNPDGISGHGALVVENPLGDRVAMGPSETPEGLAWRVERVAIPGIWRLFAGDAEVDRFAVNVDPRESDLREVTRQTIRDAFNGHPFKVIGVQDSLEEAVLRSRYGRELWKACLFLALALLMMEMVVARAGRKEVEDQ